MPTSERSAAVKLLWIVVTRATNPAEGNDVEAWLEARSEDEGGFLWLAAHLNTRPRVIEQRIRDVMVLSPRDRGSMRQRLRAYVED